MSCLVTDRLRYVMIISIPDTITHQEAERKEKFKRNSLMATLFSIYKSKQLLSVNGYVHLNMEELEKKDQNLKEDMTRQYEIKKEELLQELQEYVNSKVNKFSQINKVVLQPVPFQKTATLKIKRFLYT